MTPSGIWRTLRYETRQVLPFLLISLHSVGVTFGVIVAQLEIESIIASGAILSGLGLWIAFLAYRRKLAISLYYAFATPTVSLLCFAVIFTLRWSPQQARRPIGTSLVVFGLFNVLLSLAALRELLRPRVAPPRKGPFQFGIATIMGLTLVVAISLSLVKTLGEDGAILAALFCHFSLVLYAFKRFHKSEPPERKYGENPFARPQDGATNQVPQSVSPVLGTDSTAAPPAPDRRTSGGGE
jgi:hypothetical protein